MTMRRVKGQARTVRVDEQRTADAYRRGLWVSETLADCAARRRAGHARPNGVGGRRCSAGLPRACTSRPSALAQHPDGANARRQRGVVHAAELARGRRHLPRRDAGRHGGEPHPAVAAGPRAAFILSDADSRVIFVPVDLRQPRLRRHAGPGHRRARLAAGGRGACAATRAATPPTPTLFDAQTRRSGAAVLDPDTVRMILYTSGTTGTAEGRSAHAQFDPRADPSDRRALAGRSDGDTFLVPVADRAHRRVDLRLRMSRCCSGTTAVLMERWDPDDAVSLMLAERCTHMAGATPFLDGLLGRRRAGRHPAAGPEGVHLRRCVGAAVADPQGGRLFRAGGRVAGVRVDRGAGHDGRFAATTPIMRPTPTVAPGIADVKLVDGEIRARGPQMLVGYLHPEDETASFDDDGYFRTGDLGPLGRRRVPGGHRPSQGHHHPQRGEHLAQGSRRPSHRASGDRRDRGGRACPTSGPANGRARSS